ncbi:MAG: phage tail tape measure protein [Deltaproteobacteria bacterium]|nr:phage tail tape measure protein [Deltaproteobacteria bacterium]
MPEIGRIWATFGIDATSFEAGLKKAQRSLKRVSRRMENLGRDLSMKVSLPLAGLGGVALKMSTDFNRAMANVATLIPGNIKRVEELKGAVQDLAIETGKSTSDLAGGLYQVISAFGDTKDSIKLLSIAAKAAVAGLSSTKESIDLLSAVTKGYGDTSAEAVQKVADLAFATVKLGQTTFPELAASIGRVTALAVSLGIKMEEVFAVFATGTGTLGSTSEVATQLRGVIDAFSAPTTQMTALIKKLGFESGRAMIQDLGLGRAIQMVVEAAEASGTPLKKYIGSIEGQTLATALAGKQADEFKQKLEAMAQAAGAANQAYDEQTEKLNKLGHTYDQLKRRLEVLGQRLGDAILPLAEQVMKHLDPIIKKVEGLSQAFAAADPGTQKLVVSLGLLAAAVGPVILIFGKLAALVGGAFGVNGWVVVGVAGGIMALGGIIWGLVNVFRDAVNAIRNIGEILTDSWNTICEFLGERWRRTWEGIARTLAKALNWMSEKLSQWTPDLYIDLSLTIDETTNKVKVVAEKAAQGVEKVKEAAKQAGNALAETGTKAAISLDKVASGAGKARTALEPVKTLYDWIDITGRAVSGVTEALYRNFDYLAQATGRARDAMAGLIRSVILVDQAAAGIDKAEAAIQRMDQAMLQTQGRITEAARRMQEMEQAAGLTAEKISQEFVYAFDSISRNLADMLARGKFDFEQFGQAVMKTLINMILMPLNQMFRQVGLGLSSWITGLFGFAEGGVFSHGRVLAMARGGIVEGGVFSHGRVLAMARGGIVTRPTLFPMAGGLGLMGESGPEAVLPLERIRGTLGVRAEISSAPTHIHLHNHGEPLKINRAWFQGGDLHVELDRVMAATVRRGGEFSRALETEFGIRRNVMGR